MISPASYTSSPSLSSSSHVSCSKALEFSSKCSSSSSDPLPSSSDCTVAAAPGVVGAAARPAARPAGVGAAAAFAFSLWHCLESVMLTVMAGGDAAISGWTRADGRRAGAPKSGCNQTQRPPGHHRAAKRTASENVVHGIGNFRLPPAVTEGNARAASPDRSRAHVGERSFFLCTKYNCTRAFVPLTARVRARARERAARASQTRFPFARSCTGSIFCDPHARSSHVRHAKPVGAHHRPSSRPEPAARGEEARRPTSRTFTCHYLNVPVCS